VILGNGRKYFLHLLTPEQLKQRGMADRKARLVISAFPVLVLSNEWLELLFCPLCAEARWCHVVQTEKSQHTVTWAARELWEQVAHVDPVISNPSVSEFSRREAGRLRRHRPDQGRWFDNG
jgi:hypothetical protein